MAKIFLIFLICSTLIARNEGGLLKKLFHRDSEDTTTTTESPTTPNPLFVNSTVPKYEDGCTVHFDCKRRMKIAPTQRVCIKYCVKKVVCPDMTYDDIAENMQCVLLSESVVAQEHNAEEVSDTTLIPIKEVALIDFPCQPGYLPDSRGRCREVW